jgi:radical S-adenosyl methionine domain-containing protein 2
MKITLSGLAGSGKTTLGKMLACELNAEFVSVGEFTRKFAMNEFQMDINEFQEYCREHPEMDEKIDKEIINYCNGKEDLIIDYRLGAKFITDAMHIFLHVSPEEAFRRITHGNRVNEKISFEDINKRNDQMRTRFISQYSFDFTDPDNFHLILDTERSTTEEMVQFIVGHL